MANKKLKWYWLSFSNNGDNQGVCNLRAFCKRTAVIKANSLGLVPKHDDLLIMPIDEPELEANILIPHDEMVKKGYFTLSC